MKIPGILVDCVVVAERPKHHLQTFATLQRRLRGEMSVPMGSLQPMAMNERKIIARRAALELEANSVVNLGIGMPEGVARVADEEQIIDLMTLTAEPGVIGGVPAGGLNFGAAINAQAIIDQPYQFDFYDGGGLDCPFLGLAQADKQGNLNVSSSGRSSPAPAASSTSARTPRQVVFAGTFTAGALESRSRRELRILREGKARKFVSEVEHRPSAAATR